MKASYCGITCYMTSSSVAMWAKIGVITHMATIGLRILYAVKNFNFCYQKKLQDKFVTQTKQNDTISLWLPENNNLRVNNSSRLSRRGGTLAWPLADSTHTDYTCIGSYKSVSLSHVLQ
jgi:hypothetical protein